MSNYCTGKCHMPIKQHNDYERLFYFLQFPTALLTGHSHQLVLHFASPVLQASRYPPCSWFSLCDLFCPFHPRIPAPKPLLILQTPETTRQVSEVSPLAPGTTRGYLLRIQMFPLRQAAASRNSTSNWPETSRKTGTLGRLICKGEVPISRFLWSPTPSLP